MVMSGRERLTREKVLDAAMALASVDGLDGLSMRRLARTLGVEAMSLYNHVANKTDLLDGIAERVFAQVEPADPAMPWAQRVRATVLNLYRALSRQPVVPLALVTDRANPTSAAALKPFDDITGALYEAGFDDVAVRQALNGLTSLLFGALLSATLGFTRESARRPDAGQIDPYLRGVDPAELPNFGRLLPTLGAAEPEHDFAHALDLLLRGLVAAVPDRA